MFTGLIEEIGVVERIEERGNGKRLVVCASLIMTDLKVDDSVSINGVCLTADAVEKNHFYVDVIAETLRKTTVGRWREGTPVNLERAVRADSRLGGHFVQGHVDAVASIIEVQAQPNEWLITVEIPRQFAKYVIQHGSIALDGVSLTVARWSPPIATVSLIPHTLEKTTLSNRKPGDQINLEVDVLGKYVESILHSHEENLDERKLKSMGYGISEIPSGA